MKTFHNYYHNLIKNRLKASFVAWEQNKDDYYLKIIIDGVPKFVKVEGTPQDVTANNYLSLLTQLEMEHGRGKI